MKLPQLGLAAAAFLGLAAASHAQTAYAITSTNDLIRFSLSDPATTITIGNVGISLAGIDFSPHNGALYGISVGANTQLYTIDLTTGVPTAIGLGFANAGTLGANSYSYGSSNFFGFDVNPKTLQTDGSIRIRFVSDNGADLRLNSSTGGVAAVDPTLNGAADSAVGTGYTNNFAQLASAAGATTLFQVDADTDSLFTQSPPNNGTLVLTGSLTINAGTISGFDIFTAADNVTNTAYLATDASGVVAGSELYTVNLTGGGATLVGGIGQGASVTDIAVQPIPEPGSVALIAVGLAALATRRRRQS